MGFGDQLEAFAKKAETRAERYADVLQDEGLKELGRQLSTVLPKNVPVDEGLLRDGFTFRLENDQLVVGNDAFYSAMLARFGERHDVGEIILREAEKIIESADFRKKVQAQAFARLPAD